MAFHPQLRLVDAPAALFQEAADEFTRRALAAVERNRRFTVALSGGSTPKGLYSLLATSDPSRLPWDRMFFFWGDERHVPPDDPQSNYRMAFEALLSKVPVPATNIFRIAAENPDAKRAAENYEQTLRNFFHPAPGQFPVFDLILLGMGGDGHTASLFPESMALAEKIRFVVANRVEQFKTERLTLTLPVLNHGAMVLFLVSGPDKAPALREVLEGNQPGERYPSKLIRPSQGELMWLVDQAAAADLAKRPR
ncbi:MAG TPA: 6-phosphogluconolactonase [Terriglobales bacterium]|nr:6-phosphogluconolactonase [Terriglobales bacterium]